MGRTGVWIQVKMELASQPELRRSIVFSLLLLVSTVLQLLADTAISRMVGNLGSDLSAARGVVSTIMGFAFFLMGFLTDAVTSKVSTAAGSGDKEIIGAWIKTALLAGCASGAVTLLIFSFPYKIWLHTFDLDESSATFSMAVTLYWVRLLGLPPNLVYNAVTGVLQGLQMPGYIVVNNICLAAVDIGCNYLFLKVLGWSVVGSPLGINVAFFVSLVFALGYLFLHPNVSVLYELKPCGRLLPRSQFVDFCWDSFSLMCRSFLVELSAYLLPVAAYRLGQPQFVAYTTVVLELCKYSYFVPLGLGTSANMVGSYVRGKGDHHAAKRLLTIIPLLGLMLGIVFAFFIAVTGPRFWVRFFFQASDPQFIATEEQVRSVWWVLVAQQFANSLLAVYEGSLYATKSFGFVRNVVVSGFLLIFVPALLASMYTTRSLQMVMLAKLAYDLFRCLCYAYRLHVQLPSAMAPSAAESSLGQELGDPVLSAGP